MADYRVLPFQSHLFPKWAVQEWRETGFWFWRKWRWVTVGEYFYRDEAEREYRALLNEQPVRKPEREGV